MSFLVPQYLKKVKVQNKLCFNCGHKVTNATGEVMHTEPITCTLECSTYNDCNCINPELGMENW